MGRRHYSRTPPDIHCQKKLGLGGSLGGGVTESTWEHLGAGWDTRQYPREGRTIPKHPKMGRTTSHSPSNMALSPHRDPDAMSKALQARHNVKSPTQTGRVKRQQLIFCGRSLDIHSNFFSSTFPKNASSDIAKFFWFREKLLTLNLLSDTKSFDCIKTGHTFIQEHFYQNHRQGQQMGW